MPTSEQLSPLALSDFEPFFGSLFLQPGVHCTNKALTKFKVHNILAHGAAKLQMISDFDYTLTKRDSKSSYGIVEDDRVMPPEYCAEADSLRKKYRPIEGDPDMDEREKILHMNEWYKQTAHLMVKYKLNLQRFKLSTGFRKRYRKPCQTVNGTSGFLLREHTQALFNSLNELSIPILILSGGLREAIESVLNLNACLHANVHVVANCLSFDEMGYCTGLSGKVIHPFNKCEAAIHDSQYFKELANRHNVILMGDLIADLNMSRGLANADNRVLKIGFLNAGENERLSQYLDAFDVVLTGDPGLDFVNAIVQRLA